MGKAIGSTLAQLLVLLFHAGTKTGLATYGLAYRIFGMMRKSSVKVNQFLEQTSASGNEKVYWLLLAVIIGLLLGAADGILALLWLSRGIFTSLPFVAMFAGIVLLFVGGGHANRLTGGKVSTIGLVVLVVGLYSALNRTRDLEHNRGFIPAGNEYLVASISHELAVAL